MFPNSRIRALARAALDLAVIVAVLLAIGVVPHQG